jgi:hypothetical protein
MAVSELDIKTDLVGQAATMGICLSLLVAFIVLLATTCNWWSSSLGLVCWEPQGPLGLGTGELSIHDFLRIFTNIVSLVCLGHLMGMKPEHLQLFFGYFSLTNAHGVLTFGALLEF